MSAYRQGPMTPSQEMRKALKAKDWDWAEEIALERMKGANARNKLRKIKKLRDLDMAAKIAFSEGGIFLGTD